LHATIRCSITRVKNLVAEMGSWPAISNYDVNDAFKRLHNRFSILLPAGILSGIFVLLQWRYVFVGVVAADNLNSGRTPTLAQNTSILPRAQ
jgi:hypothetical protein